LSVFITKLPHEIITTEQFAFTTETPIHKTQLAVAALNAGLMPGTVENIVDVLVEDGAVTACAAAKIRHG